jgi:hypothetical protein
LRNLIPRKAQIDASLQLNSLSDLRRASSLGATKSEKLKAKRRALAKKELSSFMD